MAPPPAAAAPASPERPAAHPLVAPAKPGEAKKPLSPVETAAADGASSEVADAASKVVKKAPLPAQGESGTTRSPSAGRVSPLQPAPLGAAIEGEGAEPPTPRLKQAPSADKRHVTEQPPTSAVESAPSQPAAPPLWRGDEEVARLDPREGSAPPVARPERAIAAPAPQEAEPSPRRAPADLRAAEPGAESSYVHGLVPEELRLSAPSQVARAGGGQQPREAEAGAAGAARGDGWSLPKAPQGDMEWSGPYDGGAAAGRGSGGRRAVTNDEARYEPYFQQQCEKIVRIWNRKWQDKYRNPEFQPPPPTKLFSLALEISIRKDGSLGGYRVLQPSGYLLLDTLSLDSITAAAPFGALPERLGAEELIYPFTFNAEFSRRPEGSCEMSPMPLPGLNARIRSVTPSGSPPQ
ncbi:MAG: hypothetical protein HYY96_07075 [Candidatus Tectomicrobia bacterium]|nr:hypothetical protein [Candidatus Tectomicrobia bacterium]